MNKFKMQLVATLGGIITVIIITLITLSFTSFKSESVKLTKDILHEKNLVVETKLLEKFLSYKQLLSSVKANASDIQGDTLSLSLSSKLNALFEFQSGVSDGAYLFRRNGDIYAYHGNKLNVNVKQLQRSYHDALFNQGKRFFVSEPYNSATTGERIVSVAYKLDNDLAVLSAIYVDSIFGELTNRKGMFLYTSEGTILTSPYPELTGRNIFEARPLYKQFSADSPELSYSAVVNGDEVGFTAFWGKLNVSGWEYANFIQNDTIEQNANTQLLNTLVIGGISLIAAIIILLVVIQKLVLIPVGGAPEDIALLMEKMAEGDLSQNLKLSGNETGIYLSLVNFSGKLSELIKSSYNISESVSSASQELNAVMNDSLTNTQNEQTQVEQISTAINELSATSHEVSDKAVMAEEEARKAQENVEAGKQALEKNTQLTSNINASVTSTAVLLEELQQFAVKIGSVIEVITSISEQTNLLALNAAIEAARAGESGRGFAVVADEVRDLASKTQNSTISIKEIIENLQNQSEKANQNMAENVELIKESVSLADHIRTSFEDISSAVESISEINTLVATASQEQHSVTEDISKNTTQAFDLVQQNVSAATQTLQASSELAHLAEAQKNEIAFFNV